MAKGQGLIGNFKGKLGNTVGYSLKDSNNKQTQGIRVYQPVVRNPKTYAQAEQRAKLAPINATYRALKMVIDRGQEGKAYGNKSRLAWLSEALKSFNGGWFEKGLPIVMPAWVPLTKGTLSAPRVTECGMTNIKVRATGVSEGQAYADVATFSTAFLSAVQGCQEGDQITIVGLHGGTSTLSAEIHSIVLSTTDTSALPCVITPARNAMDITMSQNVIAATIILSREGSNGAHLRSTSSFTKAEDVDDDYTSAEHKEAAIESYMSQGANTDWAEESLMG